VCLVLNITVHNIPLAIALIQHQGSNLQHLDSLKI
jgi:hypothetical protein